MEAVDDRLEALERLCTQLTDVPTLAGPTPRALASEVSFIPLTSFDSAANGSTNIAFSAPR
jgi:hypothetical protein